MRCCDVDALWDDLREASSPTDDPAAVHLRSCPDCREIYRLNERVASSLSGLSAAEPPPDFHARVLVHVRISCAPKRRVDSLARVDSPIGPLFVAFNDQRISYVAVDRGENFEEIALRLERRLRRGAVVSDPPAWLQEAVDRFFRTWSIDAEMLDVSILSDFEREALRTAARIPPGEVRSYGWIAREIGRPTAARAVGRAMARNPLAIFLPCHRVVDSTGDLHNYGFGLAVKARILELEGYAVRSGGRV